MISNLRSRLIQVLHLHEPPHRTAWAFSLGVVIAFSPAYGLHTASVILCAWALRLNFLAVLAGSLINNPWTLVPILGLTFWTGFLITGQTPVSFNWQNQSLLSIYEQVIPYLASFLAGGVALSVIGGMLSFPIAYYVISRYQFRRSRAGAQQNPLPDERTLG